MGYIAEWILEVEMKLLKPYLDTQVLKLVQPRDNLFRSMTLDSHNLILLN